CGGKRPNVSLQLWAARACCFRLLPHFIRLAASRIFWTAGSSRPIKIAMIAITTNNSIRVNARRYAGGGGRDIIGLQEGELRNETRMRIPGDYWNVNEVHARKELPSSVGNENDPPDIRTSNGPFRY